VLRIVSSSVEVETTPGSNVTVALFSIRFTLASCTPACVANVFCINDWHAAHVIPVTGIVTRSGEADGAAAEPLPVVSSIFAVRIIATSPDYLSMRAEKPIRFTAAAISSALASPGSKVNCADPTSTEPSFTP
jgi:hypothetical protein